jgi:hypothetical protein
MSDRQQDSPDLTRDAATRLVADLAAIPEEPIGAHLGNDVLFGLVTNALSPSSEVEVIAHLASCASCARDAAAALEGVMTVNAREAGAAAARAFMQVVAIIAVTAARHRALGRRRLATRSVDWREMSREGFSCALVERPQGQATFLARSTTREWADVPLRCVIRDSQSGATWHETWFVMRREQESETFACAATVELGTALPLPDDWDAEISRCEFARDTQPTRAELESLRAAIQRMSAEDVDLFRRWFDDAVATGRLSAAIRHMLVPD